MGIANKGRLTLERTLYILQDLAPPNSLNLLTFDHKTIRLIRFKHQVTGTLSSRSKRSKKTEIEHYLIKHRKIMNQKPYLKYLPRIRQSVFQPSFSYHERMGLTLLECLITLALVATLAIIAIPTYNSMRIKQELRQTTVRIQNSFARMKNHAIMRQTEVVLCGSRNHIDCISDWSTGYIQFEDNNNNRRRDPSEKILEVFRPTPETTRYTISSCTRRYFRTSASGPLASIAGRIVVKPPAPYEHLTQHIVVSRLGRTRLATAPDNIDC